MYVSFHEQYEFLCKYGESYRDTMWMKPAETRLGQKTATILQEIATVRGVVKEENTILWQKEAKRKRGNVLILP